MMPERGLRQRLRHIRRSLADGVGASDHPPVVLAIRRDERIDPRECSDDHFGPDLCDLAEKCGEDLLFFDAETTGLSRQSQVFMTDFLHVEEGVFRLVQEVACDVAEERILLRSAAQRIAERPRLVTYNGRSFDVPLLRRRLSYHELPELTPDLEVIDLLHEIRRRHRKELPDCRLATVERHLIGKRRGSADVSGSEAPICLYDYRRSGDPAHMEPVLYHNRIDLTTLAALWPRVHEVDPMPSVDRCGRLEGPSEEDRR